MVAMTRSASKRAASGLHFAPVTIATLKPRMARIKPIEKALAASLEDPEEALSPRTTSVLTSVASEAYAGIDTTLIGARKHERQRVIRPQSPNRIAETRQKGGTRRS
jgi:hypothetical protein